MRSIAIQNMLAAQLALDHLKCSPSKAMPTAVLAAEKLELMAVRRCLYGDGRAAHLMYRLDGEPVSLFVLPGLARPAAEFSLFVHDQVVWTQGDRTYLLVARGGSRNELSRVATCLRNEAK